MKLSFSHRTDTRNDTLTFDEAVQSVTAGDLEVDGGVITDVDHTPGEMTGATATVTVTVDDDSTDNVEIKVTSDILDVAGNPLITKTDGAQEVDTVNPSTVGAPVVSDAVITDADDGTTLTVSFTFDEAMDTDTDPSVTFTPNVPASADGTLTGQSGAWLDDFTFEVTATVADDNFDKPAHYMQHTTATQAQVKVSSVPQALENVFPQTSFSCRVLAAFLRDR